MPSSISKEEALAYKTRWKLVREVERRELRKTPAEEKFRQLAALMFPPAEWAATGRPEDEELRIHNRWNRLRKILGG